eukprot:225421-Amorphochlora_amoeboformis.AAC.1
MADQSPQVAVAPPLLVEGADPTCSTFIIHREDHTLGNVLRYVVGKQGGVEMCGYSIHHPSDDK